jgi:hypothetical protein
VARILVERDKQEAIAALTAVRCDVPYPVVLSGAVAGTLLAGLLTGLLAASRSIDAGNSSAKTLTKGLVVHLLVRPPIGIVASIIAIVLARASLDVPGLISVELNDFLGGLVVGLFAHGASMPLAAWLAGEH